MVEIIRGHDCKHVALTRVDPLGIFRCDYCGRFVDKRRIPSPELEVLKDLDDENLSLD